MWVWSKSNSLRGCPGASTRVLRESVYETHPNVRAVLWSLSKPFGVYYHRIGGIWSRDEIPTMNDSIDRFIARAIRENANVVVWNHPEGVHGFDNQNDDARSREVIAAALDFMKAHLR